MLTRRNLLLGGLGLAGSAGLLRVAARGAGDDARLETTRIRLIQIPGICLAPQYIAQFLLRGEGFSEVHYVKATRTAQIFQALAAGEIDITMTFVAPLLLQVDRGEPVSILGGIHPGCFELFGGGAVRSVRDLKGKTVSVPELGSSHQLYIAAMASYVGLDPRRDIRWVVHPPAESIALLEHGKVDAIVGFPPVPQELRARRVGRLIVSSTRDRPWSQYFCCVIAGNRDFVHRHPVATARAMRALLRATNYCASEPEMTAEHLLDRDFAKNYEHALQTLRELPYGRWRDFDIEDTVRFYALRLREAGFVRSTPQKIIAQGTDWRFHHRLRSELKG